MPLTVEDYLGKEPPQQSVEDILGPEPKQPEGILPFMARTAFGPIPTPGPAPVFEPPPIEQIEGPGLRPQTAGEQLRQSGLGRLLLGRGPSQVPNPADIGLVQAATTVPLPFGPAPESIVGKLMLGFFVGKFAKEQPEVIPQIKDAIDKKDWPTLKSLVGEELFGAAFSAIAAHGLFGTPAGVGPTRPRGWPATDIESTVEVQPEAPRGPVQGPPTPGDLLRLAPGAPPPKGPAPAPLALLPPGEALRQATAMTRTATAGYEPPPPPRAVVPGTPAGEQLTSVQEARQKGADTIGKILELFPSLEGNREKAREIRDLAFPEKKGAPDATQRRIEPGDNQPEYTGTAPRPVVPPEPPQVRPGESPPDSGGGGGIQRPPEQQTPVQAKAPDVTTPSPEIQKLIALPAGDVDHTTIAAMTDAEAEHFFKGRTERKIATQYDAVLAGMKLKPTDVPELERLRDEAHQKGLEALQKGDNTAWFANSGKTVWLSGAIEGANRKGPNYDLVSQSQKPAAPNPEDIAKQVGGVRFDGEVKLPGVAPRWQFTLTTPGMESTIVVKAGTDLESIRKTIRVKELQFKHGLETVEEAEQLYQQQQKGPAAKPESLKLGPWSEENWSRKALEKLDIPTRAQMARFAGLRNPDGSLNTGPKALADFADKRFTEMRAPPPAAPAAPTQPLPTLTGGEDLIAVPPSDKPLNVQRQQILKRLADFEEEDEYGNPMLKADLTEPQEKLAKKLRRRLGEIEAQMTGKQPPGEPPAAPPAVPVPTPRPPIAPPAATRPPVAPPVPAVRPAVQTPFTSKETEALAAKIKDIDKQIEQAKEDLSKAKKAHLEISMTDAVARRKSILEQDRLEKERAALVEQKRKLESDLFNLKWRQETERFRGQPPEVPSEPQITTKVLKVQKENLLGQIDEALKTAGQGEGKIKFSVPGDGDFTIGNTAEQLKQFREIVSKQFPAAVKGAAGPGLPSGKGKAIPKAVDPKPDDLPVLAGRVVSDDPSREAINYSYADGTQIIATDGRQLLRIISNRAPGKPSAPVYLTAEGKPNPEYSGNFPKADQVIPNDPTLVQGAVDTDKLWHLARQAQVFGKFEEKFLPAVTLSINPDRSLAVQMKTRGGDSFEHNLQPGAHSLGEFNAEYLFNAADVARRLGNDKVDLYVNGQKGALEIVGKNSQHLVMGIEREGEGTKRSDITKIPPAVVGQKAHARPGKGLSILRNPENYNSRTVEVGSNKWNVSYEAGKFKVEKWYPKTGAYGSERWDEVDQFDREAMEKGQAARTTAVSKAFADKLGKEGWAKNDVARVGEAMKELLAERQQVIDEGKLRGTAPTGTEVAQKVRTRAKASANQPERPPPSSEVNVGAMTPDEFFEHFTAGSQPPRTRGEQGWIVRAPGDRIHWWEGQRTGGTMPPAGAQKATYGEYVEAVRRASIKPEAGEETESKPPPPEVKETKSLTSDKPAPGQLESKKDPGSSAPPTLLYSGVPLPVTVDQLKDLAAGAMDASHALRRLWRSAAMKSAPRITDASRPAGEAGVRFAVAPMVAREKGLIFAGKVMAGITDPKFPLKLGVGISEDNLRDLKHRNEVLADEAENRDEYIAAAKEEISNLKEGADEGDEGARKEIAALRKYVKRLSGYTDLDVQIFTDRAAKTFTFIGKEGSPFPTEAAYRQFMESPQTKEVLTRHRSMWEEEKEPLYRMAADVDPDVELETRGLDYGARINLKAVFDVQEVSPTTVGRPPSRSVHIRQAATLKRRNPFAIRAEGQGQAYEGDYTELMAHGFGREYPVAMQHEFLRQLIDSGNAATSSRETVPDFTINGERTRGRLLKLRPWAGSWLQVPESLLPEFDAISGLTPAARIRIYTDVAEWLTKLSITGLAEGTTHAANLLSDMFTGLGPTANPLINSLLKVMGRSDLLYRFPRMIYRAFAGTREEMLNLAEIGAAKEKFGRGLGLGSLLKIVDRGSRLVASDIHQGMARNGWVVDTETDLREFVNQLGQYNKRLQPALIRWLRDTHVQPFATAMQTFNAMGLRRLPGIFAPGAQATSFRAALALRMDIAAGWLGFLVVVGVINYLLNKKVDGPNGTRLGAVGWIGSDGKLHQLDIGMMTGWSRGPRITGLQAAVEARRAGLSGNTALMAGARAMGNTALSEVTGPMNRFAAIALTGARPGVPMVQEAQIVPPQDQFSPLRSQLAENIATALRESTPLVDAMAGISEGKSLGDIAQRQVSRFAPRTGMSQETIEHLPKIVQSSELNAYADALGKEARKLPISQRWKFVEDRMKNDGLSQELLGRAVIEMRKKGVFTYQ